MNLIPQREAAGVLVIQVGCNLNKELTMHPIQSQLQNRLHRDDLMLQAADRRQTRAATPPASTLTPAERRGTRMVADRPGAEQLRGTRVAKRAHAERVVRALGGLRNSVG